MITERLSGEKKEDMRTTLDGGIRPFTLRKTREAGAESRDAEAVGAGIGDLSAMKPDIKAPGLRGTRFTGHTARGCE